MMIDHIYDFTDQDNPENFWQITALIGGKFRAVRISGERKVVERYLSGSQCVDLLGIGIDDLPKPRLNKDMQVLKILPKLPKRSKDGMRIIYQLQRFRRVMIAWSFYDDICSRVFDDDRIERLYKVGGKYLCFGIYADEDDDYDKIPLNKWVLVAYDYRNPLP